MNHIKLTLIGGPTVLIEMGGLRLLTDPTFDPSGSEYHLGPVKLKKINGPAQTAASLGQIDAVLLSHEQHSDNLDHAGRALLSQVDRVFTTNQSAAKLGKNAIGLAPWETAYVSGADGQRLAITATPGRHGPQGAEAFSGEVTGFVLSEEANASRVLYFSGDTVWYNELLEIPQRYEVGVALLNLGAARIDAVGPIDLTMSARGAIEAAQAFSGATLVPVHIDGWMHFTESREEVTQVFAGAGLSQRLQWLELGVPVEVEC